MQTATWVGVITVVLEIVLWVLRKDNVKTMETGTNDTELAARLKRRINGMQ